jgi:hypothetical protein
MKSAAAAVLLSLMLVTNSAMAENWKTIGVAQDGTIYEIDLDSISRLPDGIGATLSAGGTTSFSSFDCRGHYSVFSAGIVQQHIPRGSIVSGAEDLVCGGHEKMPKSTAKD